MLDSNDLTLGIRQAQDDIRSYYIIGYYSTNLATDGKYRRVQIKLSNNSQAKLDYRNGYYAGKTFAKFYSPPTRKGSLRKLSHWAIRSANCRSRLKLIISASPRIATSFRFP